MSFPSDLEIARSVTPRPIVDVGINVVDGVIVGDVDFESASNVASALTPVPGGVGPLTNALLLAHLVRAAQAQASQRSASGPGSREKSRSRAGEPRPTAGRGVR